MLMRYATATQCALVWLCSRNDAIGNVVVMIARAGNRNRVAWIWRRGVDGRNLLTSSAQILATGLGSEHRRALQVRLSGGGSGQAAVSRQIDPPRRAHHA
jgi:hypothetical protein